MIAAAVTELAVPAASVATSESLGPAIVTWLTPLVVPLVIIAVKRFGPRLPSWVPPVLAPLLGIAIDQINAMMSTHTPNPLIAALLGLAGVGVRELKDQIAPAPNGGWPKVPPEPIRLEEDDPSP